MKIIFLGCFEIEPWCTHWKGIKQAGEALFKTNAIFLDIRKYKLEKISQIIQGTKDLDYIVFLLSDCLEEEYFVSECSKKAKVIFWYCDAVKIGLNYIRYNFGQYLTAFFLSNKTQIPDYCNSYKIDPEKSFYLPQACYYDFNPFNKYNKDEAHDIVFIGRTDTSFHKERTEFLNKLNEVKPITVINEDDIEGRIEIYNRMPSIYTSANFSLSLNHNNTLEGYCSNRPFNILGMGGLLLIQDFPGIEDLFPTGTCIRFEDENEFKDLLEDSHVDTILEAKKEIVHFGWRYAIRNHTYINRLIKLFSLVRSCK